MEALRNIFVIVDGCIINIHEIFTCDSTLMKQSDDLILQVLKGPFPKSLHGY